MSVELTVGVKFKLRSFEASKGSFNLANLNCFLTYGLGQTV